MFCNVFQASNAMTDIILQWQLTSAFPCFPSAFKIVTLLFDITCYLALTILGMCVRMYCFNHKCSDIILILIFE